MDAASLQTLIQLTLFVATLGGLLLNYRKSRSDERGAVHLILREDYDRLIADRNDLRAQLEASQKRFISEDRKPTILIIDDDPNDILIARRILDDLPVRFAEAHDNTTCRLALTKYPEIALLDLQLAGYDSSAAFTLIREASPLTKVIILSGYLDDKIRQTWKEKGVSECVSKNTLKMLAPIVMQILQETSG